jgi:starch-binding outer membrane protein, SusD/RagB family
MKINIKISIAILVLLGTLSSCEVERLPETQISDETFWKSESDLKQAANYLYFLLPAFPATTGLTTDIRGPEDVWSDDAFGLQPNPISDGSRLAPATDVDYTSSYTWIRAANNIIEKSQRTSTTIPIATLDRYVAEARFFRAFAYFQLLQRYGGVPLITKILEINSPELQAPAASREQVLDLIYSDLDFAAAKLPTFTTVGATDYGRIANSAALSFKARVALFEGTRAKFHNYGDANKHLDIAITASKAVINGKQHSLFNDYFRLFQAEGEGFANKENIIVRQYGNSNTDRVITHSYYRQTIELGNLNPTKSLVDAYLMKDGLPITKSPLYKAPDSTLKVFTDRDERLGATLFKRGDAYTSSTPLYTVAPLNFNKTGFTFRKYTNATDCLNNASSLDRILMRYAEVLLIYAEATFERNGSISDADLDLSINLLRARAKVAKLTNALVTTNALSMRDEIRRERRVELAQEGFRYWDILRWKTAEIELPKPVLGNFFFKSEFGTSVAANVNANNEIIVQAASFRKFDPDRDYLWAFPINELGLNPSLKQNPKW